ncbi:MAG: TonB-dependent receptor, partial [Massilia sp.]
EIVTTELALVRQFGQRARLTLTAYDNDIARLITQTYNPRTDMTRFDNARRLGARGIELEYERNWASSALLRANLSWNRVGQYAMGPPAPVAPAPMASPKMFVPGAPAPAQANAPARLAKLNAALPLAGGWMAGAEAQYVGPRRTSAGSTGGFCLLNANFYTARLAERVEASLGIANLLDRRYADPGAAEHTQAAIAQDRRHAHVRLAYVF